MNYNFEKSICAGLAYTEGSTGEWVITNKFSTDFDEMAFSEYVPLSWIQQNFPF
jgi:hypothetical protein